MEGRKRPSMPEEQSPGISQMRKKPRMWSMRYAWKYLQIKGDSGCVYACGGSWPVGPTARTVRAARSAQQNGTGALEGPHGSAAAGWPHHANPESSTGLGQVAAGGGGGSLRHVGQAPPPPQVAILGHFLPVVCGEAPVLAVGVKVVGGRACGRGPWAGGHRGRRVVSGVPCP